MPSRCILILLDGLGDRAYVGLGNKTPLQAARTPNLDRLAASGSNGLFHADRYGIALPSENAHFAIFGYEADRFPGRGYLEALGAGIPVAPGETAMLAHFVSLEERNRTLYLAKDRPEVSQTEAAAFTEAVQRQAIDGISFSYIQTKQLDGILKLSSPNSPYVTDSDCFVEGEPLLEIFPRADAEDRALAAHTAKALKKYLVWCYTTLGRHPLNTERVQRRALPINGMVTQRPGQHKEVQSFADSWGLRAVSVSSGLIYWGLGRFLGMDVHKVKDSDDPGQDLLARLEWTVQHGKSYDFIHVHTKAPDTAAHTKDPANKVKAIESLDRGLGKIVAELLDDKTVLVVTSDHSTPSGGPLVHSGEAVPLVVNGPGISRDRVAAFDEVSCVAGALGQVRHREFMYSVLNWLDRAKLQGLMDSPEDQPFWPGKRRPFRIDQ
jgi:2,3-bisphosphoglycerate-independent phosphoglycerate mutase